MLRRVLIALALLAAAPAAARDPDFPQPPDRWLLDVRGTAVPGGGHRFARIEGVPAPRGTPGDWRIDVTCGTVARTGKEIVTYRGRGHAGRGRMPGWGGPFRDGDEAWQSFIVDQSREGVTDLPVIFAPPGEDRVCPNGAGDVSTGD